MTIDVHRRMFLRGAGGAIMAIPFLPSLTTRAFAQPMPPAAVGACFLAICTDHGDVWGQNQYPPIPSSPGRSNTPAERCAMVAYRACLMLQGTWRGHRRTRRRLLG